MKNIYLLLSIWAIGLLIACDDLNLDYESSPKSVVLKSKSCNIGYEVIDGVLHFDSLQSITVLVDMLQQMSDQQRWEWEKANGFYSLYHAISDAEDDILLDSIISNEKLEKYKDIIYIDNDETLNSYIFSQLYQTICNKDGYFYIGKYKHKVTPTEIITEDGKTRSMDRRSYVMEDDIKTRASANPSISITSANYRGNKRLVTLDVIYYRNMAKNSNGTWEGQQYLLVESKSYKKLLGRDKKYKTIHVHDVLAFWVDNVAYKCSDGSYSTYRVRYEGLGGGGSVGEARTCSMHHPLTPSKDWIPEQYIPIKKSDVRFVQARARTRGTGESGAVILYGLAPLNGFPFSIPITGSPIVQRELVKENF